MSFWAYMLHCRGGAYYVGHSDDLQRRIAQHESGLIPGFTAKRLPVTLVWSAEFPTRIEALEAERRVKGWSRAKKMALIRGDWDRISVLARSKNGPSTSSGQTGEAMPVQRHSLICHPDTPCTAVEGIMVSIDCRSDAIARVTFMVTGDVAAIVLPPAAVPQFADGLWQHTCFEIFSKGQGGRAYDEVNLSPSGAWAAYRFASYREGMQRRDCAPPEIRSAGDDQCFTLTGDVALSEGGPPWSIGLSAVIETVDGGKSYWALAHPPGKPDFHHADCFAMLIEPPGSS